MPIPALRRLRQGQQEFEASQGHIEKPWLKKKKDQTKLNQNKNKCMFVCMYIHTYIYKFFIIIN
jgi:hypothetical protein